jgi:hypothetical protein
MVVAEEQVILPLLVHLKEILVEMAPVMEAYYCRRWWWSFSCWTKCTKPSCRRSRFCYFNHRKFCNKSWWWRWKCFWWN